MKQFDHEWLHGTLYVWRIDNNDLEYPPAVAIQPVVTCHRKPDSHADNPDDFYGYIDWHLEVEEQEDDWDDADTDEALAYAERWIDEKELVA